jgi:lauroyl/myristoyl acyltransferase
MYSPDISQHSPCLYRLGQHYGVPMTVLADRMIRYALKNLEHIMPEKPVAEASVAFVAEAQASYRAIIKKPPKT